MASRLARLLAVPIAGLLLILTPSASHAQDAAIAKGVQFLRGKVGGGVGETALATLALLKSDIPPGDPAVAAGVAKIRTRFASGGFSPERTGGSDIYEAGVCALALSNLDKEARRAELDAIARYLQAAQKANGSWDYTQREKGDTSISQYAVLGLWECENGGASIPPEVWDKAAQWYLSSQATGGSWNYHRDESGPETISMTAAGVGSLLICQRQLSKYRRGNETNSALLTAMASESQVARYDVTTTNARIDQAVRRGLNWLGSNFTLKGSPIIGQSAYYGLYAIERIGALAGRDKLGKVDWYDQGRAFITSTQRGDGAWDATHGDTANTAWAVLFLTKSTAKTLRRIEIKQLGAGTLLGGRGLPRDLTNLTVAGGRVVSRPMNGAVENMLAVLEDPRTDKADNALAGLVARYRVEGPAVLRPHKDRLRKLLTDRDPGLRQVAAWGLSRTGDLDVIPALIERLGDPDEAVVSLARDGLLLLSRKVDGFGPPASATPEQKAAAAKAWLAWYQTVRPLDLEGQDDDAPASPTRSPR